MDATSWFADADGDGYGDQTVTLVACTGPTAVGGDCDDADPAVNPGALDTCPDGIDHDCDGIVAVCPQTGAIDLTEADSLWDGETDNDRAGFSVAWAGEVNPASEGDARPCLGLVVGAHTAKERAEEAGAVYLLCDAPAGTHSLGEATARLLGETAGDHAGQYVAGPGDVTGDGVPDIAVGAPDADQGSGVQVGAVYLVSGPVVGDVHLEDADFIVRGVEADSSGGMIARGGDNDGDGALDLFTAAYATDYRGALAVWRGPLTGERTIDQADATVTGEHPDDWAGEVAAAEDMDGDGLDDMGTTAQGNDTAGDRYGAAYVILAPAMGEISLADADWKLVGAYFGGASQFRVAPGGDLDGDGLGEFLIGEEAPGPTRGASADQYDGAVYEIGGAMGACDELEEAPTIFRGPVSYFNAYASRPANAGDMNGDGWDDVAIGGPVWTTHATTDGAVFVVFGPSSGSIDLGAADVLWSGTLEWGMAGQSVVGAGDVDDDGCADLLVGGIGYFNYQGHAWVVGGCRG